PNNDNRLHAAASHVHHPTSQDEQLAHFPAFQSLLYVACLSIDEPRNIIGSQSSSTLPPRWIGITWRTGADGSQTLFFRQKLQKTEFTYMAREIRAAIAGETKGDSRRIKGIEYHAQEKRQVVLATK